MSQLFDSIVIGSGPAGLAAAISLKSRKKDFLLLGSKNLSSKIRRAPRVPNYLGLPSVSGSELAESFSRHLKDMDISITDDHISTVYNMGEYFSAAGYLKVYEAKTIITAIGVSESGAIPGEERLLGRGVSYCATCDAALFKNKTVAVIGYCEEAVREVQFLCEVAGKVYYIPAARSADKPIPEADIIRGIIKEISGENRAESLITEDKKIQVDGVFIIRESSPPGALIPGIELHRGFIRVDSDMQTSIPGCFAAGDCTGKPHQFLRAAGQGQTAGLSACAYLDSK